jgi:superfamily II DNA or RNA helicase
MSDLLTLRPYQDEAVDKTFEAIALGTNRPAVVLPTGAGKTVIFSWIANRWVRERRSRVLVLVHRDELATQTVNKLRDVAPTLRVGVVKAQRNEYANVDVIVGSVQTLRSFARRNPIRNIGLVIVDEAHHATAQSYIDILEHFGCFAPRTSECTCGQVGFHAMDCQLSTQQWAVTPAVGFSATLVRSDKGDLGSVWEKVVCQRDILDLIPQYLCDVRGKLVTVDGLSLSEIKTTRGDFSEASLTDALLTAEAQEFVVRAYFEHATGRKTIVFTPTVEAARAFAEAFRREDVQVAVVWGSMPTEERRLILKQFESGEIDVIVNCMVLTEGYDEPSASCAIIARPTKSAALYVQMVGRVLRKYPGKRDALVLDIVGASHEHRLATLADLTSRRIEMIEPGESLAEAAVRERKRGNPKLSGYVISSDDIDLFHRSPSVWLTTNEGIWFISTRCPQKPGTPCPTLGHISGKHGGHIWFLWPDTDGAYKVGVRPTYQNGGQFVRDGLDLETAMSWAEQFATEEDSSIASRSSSWRRRNEKPSEQQLDFARDRLNLIFPTNITKKDLSDLISIAVASSKLDRSIKR